MNSTRVLVTGATGFVGSAVLARWVADPAFECRAAYRRPPDAEQTGFASVAVGDLCSSTDWREAVEGVDVVVHTAARVHVMHDSAADPLNEFRRVNVAGTVNLARQAAAAGVRRMVFVSSIKVNGECTSPKQPFGADDIPAPVGAYGISKHEAEQELHAVARATGLEVVIIRPVLVYGPGVKANFRTMMRWIHRRLPLPLGAIHNQRSLVALGNLTDLIQRCTYHPAAANQTFLVSDGEDMSTTLLLRRMALAMETRATLIPVPAAILQAGMRLLGKGDLADRLCGSLQVDIAKTRRMLGWTPPIGIDHAMMETARWFLGPNAVSHRRDVLGDDEQRRDK